MNMRGIKNFFTRSESVQVDATEDPSHDLLNPWDDGFAINPATGLPMIGDTEAGIDIGGNCYGESMDWQSASDWGCGAVDSFGASCDLTSDCADSVLGNDEW